MTSVAGSVEDKNITPVKVSSSAEVEGVADLHAANIVKTWV
jgi:hypothetical protein